MKNSTIKVLSKLLCIVLIASFLLEAPLMAEYSAIKVNVGGQSVNVTPGQWVTVNNGPMTTHYNVRYVNGQPMALEMSQYLKLAFDGSGAAGSAAQATTAATTGSAANTGTAAQAADASTAVSGAKAEGSWIKNELNSYGQKVKDSFSSGKESGQAFGTKTTEVVKDGAGKVVDTVKTGGSKIGNLLKSAKDRISNLFKKKPVTPEVKGGSSDASQSGQTSQEGAQASQDAAQSGQTSQEGSQTSQDGAQSGQTSQEGTQASQEASQAGQTTQESGSVADADKKGFLSNLKDKTATKFKSGYETGKAMTGQGVQNVKDSLKSGFSAKNILMTAGITVGVDLATQILSGEKPSLRKAVKTVVSAEFAGGVVGSVTGAAAGSFFTPFLTAIPVVGGVLSALAPTFGSIVGGSVGAYLAGDLKNGRFSIKEAFKQINWVGVAGQTIGSTAGAMLGSMIFPPFGTIIGGIAGGMLGNWAANKLAGLFGKGKNDSYGSIGMPVGSNPFGGAAAGAQVSGPVSIGSVAGSTGGEIPVSGAQSPEITISGEAAPMGTYSSEVQLAQAKYQELYKLYNEMLTQGRQADAMKVAQEMNKAKAEYESLKANAGK